MTHYYVTTHAAEWAYYEIQCGMVPRAYYEIQCGMVPKVYYYSSDNTLTVTL